MPAPATCAQLLWLNGLGEGSHMRPSRREAPKILPAVCVQRRAPARNMFPLSLHPVLATAARFPRPRDGLQLRTTFPLLFLLRSLLRQCNAMHHQIGLIQHRALAKSDKNHGINTVDPVDRHAVIPEVSIWTASEALWRVVKGLPWWRPRNSALRGAVEPTRPENITVTCRRSFAARPQA
jgi:hypothetical protein